MDSKEWLKAFKIALIEEDLYALENLRKSLPVFFRLEELKTAQSLIAQAIALFEQRKNQTLKKMNQLKRAISFHKSSHTQSFNRFEKVV
jgi:hypothetical protein